MAVIKAFLLLFIFMMLTILLDWLVEKREKLQKTKKERKIP